MFLTLSDGLLGIIEKLGANSITSFEIKRLFALECAITSELPLVLNRENNFLISFKDKCYGWRAKLLTAILQMAHRTPADNYLLMTGNDSVLIVDFMSCNIFSRELRWAQV